MPENITGTTGFTKGAYQKPSAKDSGSDVFQVLEDFMDRMAVHKHQGKDSEIISHTITKTPFYAAAETVNWQTDGADIATGVKYLDIDITGNTLSLNADETEGSTPNDVNYMFFYVIDDMTVNDSSGSGVQSPGHERFYPDIVWRTYQKIRISTNMHETIAAASSSARIYLKAY